jgi:hypothetical protein
MVILFQFLLDVPRHGYVDVFISIIPVEGNATVEGACQILAEFVLT